MGTTTISLDEIVKKRLNKWMGGLQKEDGLRRTYDEAITQLLDIVDVKTVETTSLAKQGIKETL